MGDGEEGGSTATVRSLEVSISFGRFETDLLSWEKWSSFSQNKYLEEVEKCATPGSVAAKKAFFEARNKLIGVRKADALNKQMEVCQELEESEVQNTCVSEVDQYDEEVIDQYNEASCPLVDDYEKKDSLLFKSEPGMLNKDNTGETTHESNFQFDKYDGQKATGRVQEEHLSKIELDGCEADQPFNMQSFVLGSAPADGEEQVENLLKISSQFVAFSDAPNYSKEESLLKNEISPSMLDQLKVEDVWSCKSPPQVENEHTKSKISEDIPALKTERINAEPASNGALPDISAAKNARTQKAKPRPHNSYKKQIFPAKTQNSAEPVKKILVSSVSGSPQMATPKISRPSVPTAKSAPLLLPISRAKKILVSAPAVPKSPQIRSATRSTLHSVVSSLKQSSLSPSKKRADLHTSRKKIMSPVVSQKPTPKSFHTSLNLGSKVPGSISGLKPATEPRKSLFLEKMGDKDIIKRAFRAFQYMSTPLNIETNATSKKVVRDTTDVKPSTPLLQKEKDRLVKKSEVDMNSKKPASVYTINKQTLSKEVKKVAEKTEHLSKFKECRETCSGNRRQSLTCEAATRPGLLKRQGLSKSLQGKL